MNTSLSLILGIGMLTACSQSGGSVSDVKPLTADKPVTTGAPEIKTINKKGGTKYAVLVNNEPITTNDIRRRANFVKLRRMKGSRTAIARKELIEEKLKMQEARRINAVVSDSQVDTAYINFAKRNKIPLSEFNKVMSRSGVTKRGFKQFIKAQMSWQRAVSGRLRAESRGGLGGNKGPKYLPAIGAGTQDVKEYTVQQIVFVVPKNKRGTLLRKRRLEANQFRNRYPGCDGAQAVAVKLKDVSVISRGRVRESQMPPNWAGAISSTPVGKLTKPQDTERGVEMLAVCRERLVKEEKKSADDVFAAGNLNKAATKVGEKYLAELRDRAVIKER